MPDWSSDGYITIETMSSADTRQTNHRNPGRDRVDFNGRNEGGNVNYNHNNKDTNNMGKKDHN